MRTNLLSIKTYSIERFAELQHQNALEKRKLETRHFQRLEDVKNQEEIKAQIEKIMQQNIMKEKLQLLEKILQKEALSLQYLKKVQIKETSYKP
jgi:hypothetical protein